MADSSEILQLFTQGTSVANSDQFLIHAAEGVNGNHAVKVTAEVLRAYLLAGFSVEIGADGYWHINGEATGIKAEGVTPSFTSKSDGVYYSLDKGSTWSLLFSYSNSAGCMVVYQTDETATIRPNVLNIWGEVSTLTITLGTETENVMNEYMIEFVSGETPTVFNLQGSVKWSNGILVPEPNMTYQVSIVNGLAIYAGWSNI